ncbi:transposase [Cucumis melo var. makuwa]|uniref:Transposase n=1 Tax=Cucumis melo var. makuwa TaxID=1194695 RepID=A0A5A7U3B1_CUCMM|nr:transposase [Cucumis melo var. makuwa]
MVSKKTASKSSVPSNAYIGSITRSRSKGITQEQDQGRLERLRRAAFILLLPHRERLRRLHEKAFDGCRFDTVPSTAVASTAARFDDSSFDDDHRLAPFIPSIGLRQPPRLFRRQPPNDNRRITSFIDDYPAGGRVNKQGQYDNDDIQQVVHKIDEISMNTDSSSVNRHCSNDVLTQALGTKEHNGRVRGVGGYVTPTTYFHSVKKTSKDEANILVENEELRRRVSELEAQIRSNLSTPLSAHGSCSRPIVLEGIEEKGKRIEVESLDKPKHKEKKGKEVMKMNEPELDVLKERDLIKMPTEVVCESTSTLPLALKSILRYAEKVMEKDSSITFSLPADLFGVSRKTSVLREDIVDLCNMNEVKTFTLVAYMMYLYSSVSGSKENMQYVFVDPSLISSGNTQESRIRNLCSRLMVSKPDQVVLAPFNPGGHWALLAINAYEDTVFYLDSLRTTSKATTRYVTDTAIAIFHSQKNINKSRKQTLWRTCPLQVGSTTCGYYVMKYMREIVNRGSIVISDSIDTRKSYSQAELDEVRVELVEFLGSYM